MTITELTEQQPSLIANIKDALAGTEGLPRAFAGAATSFFAIFGIAKATVGEGRITRMTGMTGSILGAGAVATSLFLLIHRNNALIEENSQVRAQLNPNADQGIAQRQQETLPHNEQNQPENKRTPDPDSLTPEALVDSDDDQLEGQASPVDEAKGEQISQVCQNAGVNHDLSGHSFSSVELPKHPPHFPKDTIIYNTEELIQLLPRFSIDDSTEERSIEQKKIIAPRNSEQRRSQAIEADDIALSEISRNDDLQEQIPLGYLKMSAQDISRRRTRITQTENIPARKNDDLQKQIPQGFLHKSAQDILTGRTIITQSGNKPAPKAAWRP